MRPYRPVSECIHRRRGLLVGIPTPLRTLRDPIFNMLPESCRVAVEVGSQQGWFAYRVMRNSSIERLYCVDPWIGKKRHDGDGEYNYKCWKKNLSQWIATKNWESGRVMPIRMKSINAVDAWKSIESRPIDFLFIDGDHTRKAVLTDLETWEPAVRHGGLIAGHDWSEYWAGEVQPAVTEYASRIGAKISHGQIYDYTGKGRSAECWWWYK